METTAALPGNEQSNQQASSSYLDALRAKPCKWPLEKGLTPAERHSRLARASLDKPEAVSSASKQAGRAGRSTNSGASEDIMPLALQA